jgi:two-component system chemotaxis response regulator CheY
MTKKILIVDDSGVSRKMLKMTLSKIGVFDIVEASDGQEGTVKHQEHCPDITFMDLTMPVMDGYEAIKVIKERSPDAVIIVGTADIQTKSIQRIVDLGIVNIIKKPFQVEPVSRAINQVSGV